MYKIDLTHPHYFNQMKKIESAKVISVQNEPEGNSKLKFFLNLSFLFTAYVFALVSIVYCFSN